MKYLKVLLFLFLVCFFGPLETLSQDQSGTGFIDTHVHFFPMVSDMNQAASQAIVIMDRIGITKSIVMPMPFPPDFPRKYDYQELSAIPKNRFAFLGGGGTLNPIIQEYARNTNVPPEVFDRFDRIAAEIIQSGAAGFGEMTAEHLSFHPEHPYMETPPDHPLFLRLTDIAARYDVPIDLHMEAVPAEMKLPERFNRPPNPATLRENIAAFERLLSHNPKARIVWAHAGWDNTGYRTAALMERLLQAHPNLYMNIKMDEVSLPESQPMDASGKIRPEWLALLQAFPDRFMLGSDQIYGFPFPVGPMAGTSRPETLKRFLAQLPPDLARKVGTENALRVYRLK